MQRTRLARSAAAALALLVQVGGLALLLVEREGREAPADTPIRIRLLPLAPSRPMPDPLPPPQVQPRAAPPRSTAPPAAPATRPTPAPESPARGITLAPADWYAELEAAARRRVEQDARLAKEGQPLDSKPQVLELPEQAVPDERITLLPNGDLQTHTRTRTGDIVCTHSPPALDEAFSVWAKHRPPKCTFKGRPAPSVGESMEEAVKPGYLRRPPGAGTAGDEPP